MIHAHSFQKVDDIREALGVSLAAKYYLIIFFKGATKDQMTNICSELSVRSGATVALASGGSEPTRIHAAWPVEDWTDAAAVPGGESGAGGHQARSRSNRQAAEQPEPVLELGESESTHLGTAVACRTTPLTRSDWSGGARRRLLRETANICPLAGFQRNPILKAILK